VTTKLTLWNRLDPRDGDIHDNSDDADDPEHLGEVGSPSLESGVSKNDGKDLGQRLALFIAGQWTREDSQYHPDCHKHQ
jgi:hypothetical protein